MFFVEIAITIAIMISHVLLGRLSGRKTSNNEVTQLKKKIDSFKDRKCGVKTKTGYP
jgi:hypothetical protein